MMDKRSTNRPIRVVVTTISALVFLLVSAFVVNMTHYVLVQYKIYSVDQVFESRGKNGRKLTKEFIDKNILKGFGQKTKTDPSEMHTATKIYIEKYKGKNVKTKVVAYSKYFVEIYEVIYDGNDIMLNCVNSYE
jgi:hypothetical protein